MQAFGVQSISGTGALKNGFDFLKRNGYKFIYVSHPTWGNHISMGKSAGFEVRTYRYYEPSTKSINIDGMLEDFRVSLIKFW